MNLQSIILKKSDFETIEAAEETINELGYNEKYRNKRINQYKAGMTTNYYRFRMLPPSQFDKDSFSVTNINDKIFMVYGKKKLSNKYI